MSQEKNTRLGAPKSIAIFRALFLGDLLCTVPAFRALRLAYPESKITLISLPWAQSFADRFAHIFDDFLPFPGFPGLTDIAPDIHRIPSFFRETQKRNFDLAIQMHGTGEYANPATILLGAKRSAGFYFVGGYCPEPDHDLFMPFPHGIHEIIKYLRLMEFLGVPLQGTHLEFPITARDKDDFHSIDGIKQLKGDYVCIHPGAKLLSRRWFAERFAAVARQLAASGLLVVLTGTKEEEELVNTVSSQLNAPHINLAGKTTLGSLAILLKGSRLLISNDTGVSHMASALKVPSVIIVTGSDFRRWAPLNNNLHKFIYAPVNCRPCTHYSCPIGHPCAQEVSVQDVVNMSQRMLKQTLLVP